MKKFRPLFTLYGAFILVIMLIGNASKIEYDSVVLGLLYHFVFVPILGFFYWIPNELFLYFNNGQGSETQWRLSVLVGLLFCFFYRFGHLHGSKEKKVTISELSNLDNPHIF